MGRPRIKNPREERKKRKPKPSSVCSLCGGKIIKDKERTGACEDCGSIITTSARGDKRVISGSAAIELCFE